jgi:replication initiation protein RepC
MSSTLHPGAGFRRHDAAFLAAEEVAKRFQGLARDVTPGKVVAAFKRAAKPMGVPRSVRLLIDQLFARTQPQDWLPGAEPIVWAKNETLADELDLSVRQLQNVLRRAIELGLVSQKDSPNGHRGGRRGPNGAIQWAYGIDLRPMGTRYPEFLQVAAAAAHERQRGEELRRRLTIARKAIAQLAQTALEEGLTGADWLEEVDTARMAAAHARGLADLDAQIRVVEQIEQRRAALMQIFRAGMDAIGERSDLAEKTASAVDISCIDEAHFTHSTTTNQTLSSKEHTYSAWREGSSRPLPSRLDRETSVTRDLDKYGVDIEFIADVCREVCWELTYGSPRWDDLVAIGRREAQNLHIPASAWNEAVRIMGHRGAAAAMIAVVHKADAGLIERPGAYLRGMTERALIGELQLGRTFHGFREARRAMGSA